MAMLPLRKRPAYAALAEHHAKLEGRHLRDLFDDDPNRGARLCAEAAGLYLDYSKNRITDETLDLLLQLAEQSDLEHRRDMMFAGVIFSEELGDASEPCERLLGDALHGNASLFTREDSVEETWRIVEPLLESPPPVETYEPGSWGPKSADTLLSGHSGWRQPWTLSPAAR